MVYGHNGGALAKGLIIGVVAGAAIGFAVTPKNRDARRAVSRIMRTAGDVVDTVSAFLH
ncbi:MAG: hypothetical protein LBS90_04835 [Oscillospiraceae bacterium]|jgi:hypothetical protein|nr:hypothetical protein [Oscillospiraceae bacterium]